jgi:outer membrane protein assembly factor BamB
VSEQKTDVKPIRLLPGIIIVGLTLLIRFGIPIVVPNAIATSMAMMMGPLGAIAIMVWWGFFSRAPKGDRWLGVLMMFGALALIFPLMHVSIRTGMMGLMYPMYAFITLLSAFILWAVFAKNLPAKLRRLWLVVALVLSCAVWTLVQSTGIGGGGGAMFSWRWTPTAEQQLLAQGEEAMSVEEGAEEALEAEAIWPGFRGPNRDSIIHGSSIATDWTASPPQKLWSRKIGPGCSSFSVQGSRIYTQEQRGKNEMVSCYNLTTGKPIWQHKDKERFWDSHAGAGPRSTPTLADGQVYTFGPTGILNALNAKDGSVIWMRHLGTENQVKLPIWALTSSPLVKDDLVIVAIEGMLLAFDRATGEERWRGPNGGKSYSSPHLMTLDGVEQVLQICAAGVISVTPADGIVLWEYKWAKGEPITQPALMENGDLLITSGEGFSLHRIAAKKGPEGWTTKEIWKSGDIKPYFNDIVVHKGYVYGFDVPALVCVNLEDGTGVWRGGKFGGGQLMLLADQDLLVVISEKGELALVEAKPDKFAELAKMQGIEGKVWNHHVLVNDILLVRNAFEMIAYKLAVTETTETATAIESKQ